VRIDANGCCTSGTAEITVDFEDRNGTYEVPTLVQWSVDLPAQACAFKTTVEARSLASDLLHLTATSVRCD
jgi:hypothetical protein